MSFPELEALEAACALPGLLQGGPGVTGQLPAPCESSPEPRVSRAPQCCYVQQGRKVAMITFPHGKERVHASRLSAHSCTQPVLPQRS